MTAAHPPKLSLLLYPDPRLKKPAAVVTEIDTSIRHLAERMLALMVESEGVGLAAPQVGSLIRLFVCNATGKPGDDEVWVNPRIVEQGPLADSEEGCLSIPKVRVTVRRATEVVMEATDLSGRTVRRTATELRARVWQHEIDHLEGRLIIDRMSEADRIATRRSLRDLEKSYKPPKGSR